METIKQENYLNQINILLPCELENHQSELEQLILKVFPNGISNNENINLARQLVLNWCSSMCRKLGIHCEVSL